MFLRSWFSVEAGRDFFGYEGKEGQVPKALDVVAMRCGIC